MQSAASAKHKPISVPSGDFLMISTPALSLRLQSRLVIAVTSLLLPAACLAQNYLSTKAPYSPRQDAATYEAAPAGFRPIFVQMVARHGSRGLSSPSNDLALYNMWLAAQANGGLTEAGGRLGAELLEIIRANAVVGYNVPGITAPGYGNLTRRGIAEHTMLAGRLAQRVAPLLANAVTGTTRRQVIVSTSGVNRAVDSAHYFTQSLAASVPGFAALTVNSHPLTAYPVNAPVAQGAGTNRFQLYFHKLNAKTDLPAATDPVFPVYQASRNYQNYVASDPTVSARVDSIVYSARSHTMARTVLETVFTKSFLDALDKGAAMYSNGGTFTFTSDDGKFTAKITGDGSTVLANAVDAASALYAVYSITPSMDQEVKANFAKYFPPGQLDILGYLSDAQDFYQKGPGIREAAPVTYKMSQALLDDFFAEQDAIAAGRLTHAAKLRFTHAEIIIPFATRLRIANAALPAAAADTYT